MVALVDQHKRIATTACSSSIGDRSLLQLPSRSLGARVDAMTTATNIAHLVVGAIGEDLRASAHRALLRIVAVAMVVVWESRRVHFFCFVGE